MNMLGTPERETRFHRLPAAKPHITKAFGAWVCYSLPPAREYGNWIIAASGETPAIAAEMWKAARDRMAAAVD